MQLLTTDLPASKPLFIAGVSSSKTGAAIMTIMTVVGFSSNPERTGWYNFIQVDPVALETYRDLCR